MESETLWRCDPYVFTTSLLCPFTRFVQNNSVTLEYLWLIRAIARNCFIQPVVWV